MGAPPCNCCIQPLRQGKALRHRGALPQQLRGVVQGGNKRAPGLARRGLTWIKGEKTGETGGFKVLQAGLYLWKNSVLLVGGLNPSEKY